MPRNIEELHYPTRVTLAEVLRGMWRASKIDVTFHGLMAILLVSGLLIDLLGKTLGGNLATTRVLHGYLGAVFILVYIAYIIKILSTKRIRMLMTAVNYADFILYTLLILTGIVVSSLSYPWSVYLPTLQTLVYPVASVASTLHTITTYVFLVVSIFLPGGFLHGIATGYLIMLKGKSED
jgi:hypothetical protein